MLFARKNCVLNKVSSTIGTLQVSDGATIEFNELVAYESGKESESIRGLNIQISEDGRYEKNYNSFLENNGLDTFVKEIYSIYTTSMNYKGYAKDYTEVCYTTEDNFRIGFYQKGTEQTFFVASLRSGKTNYFLKADDFTAFIQLAGKSKNILLQK